MRVHWLVGTGIVLGLALSPARVRGEAQLTLESAVRDALSNNERARKAPLRIMAAQGQLERSRASFLPSLNASGTGTLSSGEDRSGRHVGANGTLTLTQPILSLPAIPLYRQSRYQLESERWGAVQDLRLVAFDTARAFLIVLTSGRVLEAANGRLERARANQLNAEVRAKAQLASTNDVTRARIETAAAAREVAQAQGSVGRAYLSLGFLVGRTVTGQLATPDRTTEAAATAGFGLEDLVRQAAERRPDVRSAHERTAALREAANEPLYRLAPTLTAQGQVRLGTGSIAPEPIHDESAVLALSWNIYDAGVRYADRKTRLAQADSQALDEQLLRRSIATDINIALTTLQASRESYKISLDAVEAAQHNTEETGILYKQGLARAIELVDANGRRFDAEVNRATAQLGMEQAYLELRYALGLNPTDDDTGAPQVAPQGGTP